MCVGLQPVVSAPAHSSWSLNRKKLDSWSVNQQNKQAMGTEVGSSPLEIPEHQVRGVKLS